MDVLETMLSGGKKFPDHILQSSIYELFSPEPGEEFHPAWAHQEKVIIYILYIITAILLGQNLAKWAS